MPRLFAVVRVGKASFAGKISVITERVGFVKRIACLLMGIVVVSLAGQAVAVPLMPAGVCLAAPKEAAKEAAPAAAPAASEGDGKAYKIGVVNRKEVFDAYKKTKAEYDSLQKEVNSRQKTVDDLSAKIETAKKEYEAKKDKMGDQDREEFKAKVESDYRHYQSEMRRLQGDIDSMELRVVKKLFGEIDKAIAAVASEGNYHLVLDGTPKETPGSVIYFSATLNITGKVIDYVNSHDLSEGV